MMTITEVSPQAYEAYIHAISHVYDSVTFSELNRGKAESLHYLLFKDSKTRFGIILGERGSCLYAPFSAPFGGLESNTEQRLEAVEEAVTVLAEYARNIGKSIRIILPPAIYQSSQTDKLANILIRQGKMLWADINYSFHISNFHDYESRINRMARKNLHHAMQEDMTFNVLCSDNPTDVSRAYNVIKQNREEHGYPLRMTLDDVQRTVQIIPADFFTLSYHGIDIAAAQVFHVSKGIAQVIYWGDLKEYSHLRTMNRLAYEMFKHYSATDIHTLDIGPSSEQGVPNYGLCDFKESIGCSTSLKYTFQL